MHFKKLRISITRLAFSITTKMQFPDTWCWSLNVACPNAALLTAHWPTLGLAYFFGRVRPDLTWASVLTAYFIGGSVTQVFGVIIHEACHSLCFKSKSLNRAVGFMANICIPFPIYASFRRYHLEHHAYQGVEGKDPDLPLKWEVKFIKGNPLQKFVFLFFYPMV